VELTAGTPVTPQIRLLRRHRRGGMGSVWIAEHLALRTEVVVKFMSDDLAADPAALARFSREAAAAAQVKSPHVVQVLDHGITPDGQPFIVMELLEGKDLAHFLRDRTLTPAETAHIVEHLARALTRAHERGILHRDIKPANIFLCDVGAPNPFVKLIDFGIAKGLPGMGEVTSTGDTVGTPQYMSPEQLQGERDIDLRADLWSVGVVAFRCLTGATPFEGDSIASVALKVVMSQLPRPTSVRPDLPQALDVWFAQACARDRAQRFKSAREMADALWRAVSFAQPTAVAITSPSAQRSDDPSYGGAASVGSAIHHARPSRGQLGALGIVTAVLVVAIFLVALRIVRSQGAPASAVPAASMPADAPAFLQPPAAKATESAPPSPEAASASASSMPPSPTATAAPARAVSTAKARPVPPKKPRQGSNDEPDDGF
jgi:eukaryotic-like serine/threonine-protein kinase